MWLLLAALLAADCPDAARLDGQGQAMLDPLREKVLRPAEVIARWKLPVDAVVADVGAGPGFFAAHLSRAVPKGRVIATDIRRDYLDHIDARRLPNVSTKLAAVDDPSLPPRSVDVALLCQVDQYLRDRADYFARLKKALRPGGRIVLVNYAEFRGPDLAAAARAGLHTVDEWQPSVGFFMLAVAP
jgi:trans-aconitate methyltransferase